MNFLLCSRCAALAALRSLALGGLLLAVLLVGASPSLAQAHKTKRDGKFEACPCESPNHPCPCTDWWVDWRTPEGKVWGASIGTSRAAVEEQRAELFANFRQYQSANGTDWQHPSEAYCQGCKTKAHKASKIEDALRDTLTLASDALDRAKAFQQTYNDLRKTLRIASSGEYGKAYNRFRDVGMTLKEYRDLLGQVFQQTAQLSHQMQAGMSVNLNGLNAQLAALDNRSAHLQTLTQGVNGSLNSANAGSAHTGGEGSSPSTNPSLPNTGVQEAEKVSYRYYTGSDALPIVKPLSELPGVYVNLVIVSSHNRNFAATRDSLEAALTPAQAAYILKCLQETRADKRSVIAPDELPGYIEGEQRLRGKAGGAASPVAPTTPPQPQTPPPARTLSPVQRQAVTLTLHATMLPRMSLTPVRYRGTPEGQAHSQAARDKRGNADAAMREAKEALRLGVERPGLEWNYMGLEMLNAFPTRRPREAVLPLRMAIRMIHRRDWLGEQHGRLSEALLLDGQYEEAELEAKEAQRWNPWFSYNYIIALELRDKRQQAERLFRSLSPADQKRALGSIEGIFYNSQPEVVENIANAMIRLAPYQPEGYALMCSRYCRQKEWKQAESYCRDCIRYAPEEWPYHQNLAQILDSEGKADEAKKEWAITERLRQKKP